MPMKLKLNNPDKLRLVGMAIAQYEYLQKTVYEELSNHCSQRVKSFDNDMECRKATRENHDGHLVYCRFSTCPYIAQGRRAWEDE